MKNKFFALLLCLLFPLCSCSEETVNYDTKISEAISKTNSEIKYKASFVAEVSDMDTQDLIMFVQGNYQIDKQNSTIANGELVQTVFDTPSSLEFGFYDNTYVTITDNVRILSTLSEEELYKQFMFSPSVDFSNDELKSVENSTSSAGTIYTISIKDEYGKKYLDTLFGDDIYTFSSMKKVQKELTEYKNFICKYVISDDGYIVSREISYEITAYDTVPYFPGVQGDLENYKREFSVSIKMNYKTFGNDVEVDISDFVFEESADTENNTSSSETSDNTSNEKVSSTETKDTAGNN
jgi:hypothetical protein